MKKTIAVLLVITLLFPFSAGAFSAAADTPNIIAVGDFRINTNVDFDSQQESEAQIIGYTGTESIVNIPEYLEEYKVTAVNYHFVSKKACVTQINLPKTVVDIDNVSHNPLEECINCTAINVDADNPVFLSENGILYSKDQTVLLRVPCAYPGDTFTVKTGVKTIARGAMADCKFTEIRFPETLEYVGQNFMEHSLVQELYFPDSLQGMSNLAFHYVTNLKYVYFGARFQLSGGFNQLGCIREYAVSGANPYLSCQDGVLFNKDKTKLIAYPTLREVDTYVVPDSCKTIGTLAFSKSYIKTINTNQVESIEQGAFYSIVYTNSLIFGDALKAITLRGDYFDAGSVTFLSRDCEITVSGLPGSNKRPVYGYFGSTAYQTFYLNENYSGYFNFVLLDEEQELGFQYTELTGDTVRIDSFAGFDTSVEVPAYIDGKKVVQIGANCFAGNTSITELTLPQTLETIDSYAFKDLTKVETITIPASVKSIGSFALSDMSALKKLYIHSFACAIGENALPGAKVFACSGSTVESYAANAGFNFYSVGHQFVSEEIENNKIRKTCTLCGYTEVTDNPIVHHEYESTVIEPTCTEQGYTVHTCTICGDTYNTDYKAALGHDPFEIKATSPTCTVEGKTAGIRCARCQEILKAQEPIAKLPHEYDGGITTTAPTCTEEGIKTFTCRNCDAFYTEPIEKTEHRYIPTVKAPTCTEAGYTTYTCAYCHDSYVAEETAVLPHTPQEIPAVAATCTKEGSTAGSRCAACGLVLLAPQQTDKVPHQYDSGKVTLAPACQREGTKTFTCKNCSASYEEKMPVIGHNYITVVKKAASFSQNGVLNNECSMCRLLRKSAVVKSLRSAALTATVLTYTGKALAAPKVTVKDSAGKTVAAKYYTVTCISRANGKAVSNISAIGQYKVKITFKGAYTGTKYLYFTVKPRTVTQYAPLAAKSAVTARWRKDTSVSGYQVIVATNRSFTAGKKTVTVNTNALAAKTITGLQSGKVYFVKMRSYKTIVVDGKKLKIFSSYSALKAVKCK